MNDGWIKVYRKLRDNPRAKDPYWVALWVWMLLEASHKPHKALFDSKIIELKPGQFISGRHKMAENTGISENTVRRILNELKNDQQIHQQISNVSSLFTILNWDEYQSDHQQIHQPSTSKPPANHQQTTTVQECNNVTMQETGEPQWSWPIIERWLINAKASGADYTEEEAKFAFKALAANGFKWGKNPIMDIFSAIERQIDTDRRRYAKGNGNGKLSWQERIDLKERRDRLIDDIKYAAEKDRPPLQKEISKIEQQLHA